MPFEVYVFDEHVQVFENGLHSKFRQSAVVWQGVPLVPDWTWKNL